MWKGIATGLNEKENKHKNDNGFSIFGGKKNEKSSSIRLIEYQPNGRSF